MRPTHKFHSLLQWHLEKIAPVVGVSIEDPNDRTTWRIDYEPEPTEEQRAAAQAALLSYEMPEEPPQLSGNEVLDMLVAEGVVSKAKADAVRAAKSAK